MSTVICYGSLLPDRVLHLPRFPQPGEGVHALSETLYLGGEPCNVGGHLATWGERVTLAGNNLGSDQLGEFVRGELAQRSHTHVVVQRDPAIQTPTCYIWTTPDGERTIVPSWPTPTGWTLPPHESVQSARIVSASIFGPGMQEMIALARTYGVPLAVADIAGPDDERLLGAVIVTTSRAVLARRHGIADVQAWMTAVHARTGALVVVSDGARTAQAISMAGEEIVVQPPTIQPIDTTGAGDTLKAGLILGWLRDWPVERSLRFAIAAASLQCLQAGPCTPSTTQAIDTMAGRVTFPQ